jgi:endonuclease/exonuclease/phosphatase (EEP) superfamily protein YafD
MIRRLFAAAFVLAGGAALLVVAWPQLFSLERSAGIAQLVSLRGAAIALAALLLVTLLLIALASRTARRFTATCAVLLLGFILLSSAVVSSRGLGNPAFETRGDNDITVLAWNTLGDAPGAEAIAGLAVDTGADVISLPETTEDAGVAIAGLMRDAGKPMWVHTVAYDQISKARSTTLLISAALGAYEVSEQRTTSVLPTVIASPTDGSGPTIIAVHAVAPIPGQMQNWRDDLVAIANACTGDNIIMAGDFNATTDHFSGLAADIGAGADAGADADADATLGQCLSADIATQNASVGTWPTFAPALLGAPIDHVMNTPNWRVSGMRVIQTHDGYGSDHRPIVAQLTPAG